MRRGEGYLDLFLCGKYLPDHQEEDGGDEVEDTVDSDHMLC